MVKSPPALHRGSFGEFGTPFDEPIDSFAVCVEDAGGAGGALGAIYVSLNWCVGAGGRLGARVGGASSSFEGPFKANGPDMDFPLIVGVTPGVSDEDAEEGEVSAPDEELIELIVFFTAPEATSFRDIDFAPPESTRTGVVPVPESKEGLELCRDSNEGRGGAACSGESNAPGESVLGILIGISFLGGADKPPPEVVDLATLPSLISDCESLLDMPVFLPFGTSPKRNFSPAF